MRTVIFQVSGHGSNGEAVVVTAAARGGGQSHARYFCKGESRHAYLDENEQPQVRTRPADSPEDIAEGLAQAVNSSNEFAHDHLTAAHVRDLVTLTCSDIYVNVKWTVEVQGPAQTVRVQEFC